MDSEWEIPHIVIYRELLRAQRSEDLSVWGVTSVMHPPKLDTEGLGFC